MSQPVAPYRTGALSELRRAVTNVAVPQHEPPVVKRRRRVVVAVTLVIGAAVLGFSLRRTPGESSFYWLTLVLAAALVASVPWARIVGTTMPKPMPKKLWFGTW